MPLVVQNRQTISSSRSLMMKTHFTRCCWTDYVINRQHAVSNCLYMVFSSQIFKRARQISHIFRFHSTMTPWYCFSTDIRMRTIFYQTNHLFFYEARAQFFFFLKYRPFWWFFIHHYHTMHCIHLTIRTYSFTFPL